MRLSSQRSKTVISPVPPGLDGAAVPPASPRLAEVVLESSSPETILGDKSNCSESQLLGSPDIAVLNTLLLRATARRSTPPYGGVLPLTELTHLRRGSRRGRPARSRAWPPQWGSVRVGSVCVAVAVAVATAGANRGRNHGRKQGLAPDPTGGSAAAPGHGPGLSERRGRLL